MKKLILIVCVVFVSATLIFSQKQSNGTGGGDWNTAATWNPTGVPIGTDNVTILTNDVVNLAASGTCANLTMQANSSLSINTTGLSIPGSSWNLDATSTVTFNGPTTVQSGPTYGNLVYSSVSGGPNGDLTVNGNLTVTTATFRGIATTPGTRTITIGGNVIIGTGTSARISAVNLSSSTAANCTWNIAGNVSLTGNNSGNRLICYESAGPHTGSAIFNINGDLSIGSGSQVSLKSSTTTTVNYPEGIINLKGNLIQNGVLSILSVTSGTSPGLTINFTGTSNQTWSGTGTFDARTGFPINFNVNNSAGVTLSAAKTMAANMVFTLTNGKLSTTSSNLLTINAGTLSGGSSSSFVNGPLVLTSAANISLQNLTFPIGTGTSYRPITVAVTQTASTATPFTAQVINGSVPSNTLAGTNDKISTIGYATVSGSNVTSATVQLSYIAADNVSNAANLRIAQGPSAGGGTWVDVGGTGSATPAGTITSNSISDLTTNTAFVLANNTGGTNALPIELTSFNAIAKGHGIELAWKTATEINNAGFAIEQKGQNNSWNKIGYVEGAGTTNSPKQYSYFASIPVSGKYEFRLKQIDRDGKFEYSPTVEATVALTAQDYSLTQNYPNPFNPSTTFSFAMKNGEQTTVKVYNLVGQEVATLFNQIAQPNELYTMKFDAKNLPSGIYFYSLHSASRNEVKKMSLVK